MANVDLHPPDIDADESSDRFRRLVAVLVAALTLLGTAVAYLEVRESHAEAAAGREAQRHALLGLGAQAEGSSRFTSAYDVYGQAKLIERRATLSKARARFELGKGDAAAFTIEAEGWTAVRKALNDLSPLLTSSFDEAAGAFPSKYAGEVQIEADRAALRAAASAELQESHGARSSTLVTVITILAMALFLIGLSLTVTGGSRLLLVGTGAVVALWATVWSALVLMRPLPATPEGAIVAVAQGNSYLRGGSLDDAIKEYDRAIDLRSDYASAFVRRADATFAQGSPQAGGLYTSITKDENLAAAIRDQERAMKGARDDIGLLANLGFNYFLARRYDESVRLTKAAIELNDALPFLWYNLGVAQLARGNVRLAERAYDAGNDLNAEPLGGDDARRRSVAAGARTDLELLARAEPARAELALRFSAVVTAAEASSQLKMPLADVPGNAAIRTTKTYAAGSLMQSDFDFLNLPADTAMSYIWFHRAEATQPWSQIPHMNGFERLPGGGMGKRIAYGRLGTCPTSGQYRVDIYAGPSRLSTSEVTVPAGRLGPLASVRDEVRGVTMCVPAEWKAQVDPELDALTYIGAGVGTAPAFVSVTTFIVPGALTGTASELADTFLRALSPTQGNFQSIQIGGVAGRVATLGTGLSMAVAVGPDNVLRFVSWFDPSRDVVAAEILPTIAFDVAT